MGGGLSGWGHWIVDAISFQKIFGLCGLKGHIVDKRWGVTTVTHGNVKIVLESSKQDSQLVKSTPHVLTAASKFL